MPISRKKGFKEKQTSKTLFAQTLKKNGNSSYYCTNKKGCQGFLTAFKIFI